MLPTDLPEPDPRDLVYYEGFLRIARALDRFPPPDQVKCPDCAGHGPDSCPTCEGNGCIDYAYFCLLTD